MAIRKFRPYTQGTRQRVVTDFSEITGNKPEKSLIITKHRLKGRNNRGVITCRHRGGGHKRQYRIVDFRRDKRNINAKVAAIHYDPHRNARLALLFYEDGEKKYIIAPAGIKVGQNLIAGDSVPIEIGNAMPLAVMPLGSSVHCVELYAGKGGQMVRTAGGSAQVMAKEGDYVALTNVGAYGMSLSSNYNTRPTIAEIIVNGSKYKIIRKRQSLENLVNN